MLNLVVKTVIVVPAMPILMLFGKQSIHTWTGGLVQPTMALRAALVLAMLAIGVRRPLTNLLLAINLHANFLYLILASPLVSLASGHCWWAGLERLAWPRRSSDINPQ